MWVFHWHQAIAHKFIPSVPQCQKKRQCLSSMQAVSISLKWQLGVFTRTRKWHPYSRSVSSSWRDCSIGLLTIDILNLQQWLLDSSHSGLLWSLREGSNPYYPRLDAGGGALVFGSCEQSREGDHVFPVLELFWMQGWLPRDLNCLMPFKEQEDVCRVRVRV